MPDEQSTPCHTLLQEVPVLQVMVRLVVPELRELETLAEELQRLLMKPVRFVVMVL